MNSPIVSAPLAAGIEFFISTLSELLLLFVGISMLVIWLQDRFPAKRIQALLSGGRGYLTAAALGAITPFCSCSTLPMLVGMLRANAAFGPVMTFLLTSPLLNPVLLVLLWSVFGAELSLLYSAAVLLISLSAGLLLSATGFARYVRLPALSDCGCSDRSAKATPAIDSTQVHTTPASAAMANRAELGSTLAASFASTRYCWSLLQRALQETRRFLPHLLAGVLVGALIHGYVPADFFSELGRLNSWLLIPLAALIGMPLYVRASSMIPLALSLIGKGMSYGSVMALTIGGAGASLPELIILKRVFQWPLLLAFVGVVFLTACLTGLSIDLLLN